VHFSHINKAPAGVAGVRRLQSNLFEAPAKGLEPLTRRRVQFLGVPAKGFEPLTRCREQFLRLPRIPFRHAGQRAQQQCTR
jgi:hypothetical protein